MITNSNITIVNKYFDVDSGLDRETTTTLSPVFFSSDIKVSVTATGLVSGNTITVLVPIYVNSGSKEYISSQEWQELEDKTGYFTIQNGDCIIHEGAKYLIIGYSDNRIGINKHLEITAI